MNRTIFTLVLSSLLVATASVSAQNCNTNIPLSRPDSRYSDNGDGTVTDTVTGLMWKQCPEGVSNSDNTNPACDVGSASVYTWQGALAVAQNINISGYATYTDWRLPNIKELKSLSESACDLPAINANYFPATPSAYFWSSSPEFSVSTNAWYVYSGSGYDASGANSATYHVRLVRSGP